MKEKIDQSLYIECYNELVKKTGDIPTIEEVDKYYKKKYGPKYDH